MAWRDFRLPNGRRFLRLSLKGTMTSIESFAFVASYLETSLGNILYFDSVFSCFFWTGESTFYLSDDSVLDSSSLLLIDTGAFFLLSIF